MRKALSVGLGLAVILCLAVTQYTFAQDDGQGRGRRDGQGMRRGGQWDPARMREMMAERLKETLGCTEEEWKVIGPRVEKVAELQMRTRMRGGMMRRPRRDSGERPEGGREGRPEAGSPEGGSGGGQSADMPEAEELRTTLDDESASADTIKAKLTAYRKAVKRNEAELQKARESLREVLSVRQEAQLVLSGLLD